jgi:hypothetical protein
MSLAPARISVHVPTTSKVAGRKKIVRLAVYVGDRKSGLILRSALL